MDYEKWKRNQKIKEWAVALVITLALFSAIVALAGCDGMKRVPGPTQYEDGVVEAVLFQPSQHGSGTGYAFTGNGGPTITSVDIPEKRTIVFRCEHGRFALESDRHELVDTLWQKLDMGDHVQIAYRSIVNGRGEFVKYETIAVTEVSR
jgi:hypothetical protein